MSWLRKRNLEISQDRIQSALNPHLAGRASANSNRRDSQRVPCQVLGEIVLPRGTRISVSALDISETGIRLHLGSSNRLPQRFQVVLPTAGIDHMVQLDWQTSFEAGAYYIG